MPDDAQGFMRRFRQELEAKKAAGWQPEVGPDCKRCGAKDCHPIFHGYCSNQCEDMAEDEARIVEMEARVERLEAENMRLRNQGPVRVAAPPRTLARLQAELGRLREALENSPVVLRSATFNGERLRLTRELWLPVKVAQADDTGTVHLEVDAPELGLSCHGRTRRDLVDALEEEVHVMFYEYALAEPEDLVPAAQQVRLVWRELLHGNAPLREEAPNADQA